MGGKNQAAARERGRRKRRQWGSDSRSPLPAVPSAKTERLLSATRIAIFVTVIGWVAFVATTLSKAFFGDTFSIRYAVDAVVYLTVVTLLTASALAYLLARLGFAHRARKHERVPRSTIDSFFAERSPDLTVLVPSYREDASVIRQTLLSAALQEYPSMNVVLLIDDPPNPDDPHQLALLESARALPGQINELLQVPHERFERAAEDFRSELADSEVTVEAMRTLAAHYVDASTFLTTLAADFDETDASEKFVRNEVIGGLARRPDDGRRCAAACGATRAPRSRRRGWCSCTSGSSGRSRPRSRASSASATSRSRTRPTRP